MYRIFLTREQYDLMVTRLHSWVKANWLTLDRAWTLNGVSVQCQTQDQLAVLAGHVAKCGGSARVALQEQEEQEELQDDWCNLCHNRGCYNCR